MPRPQQYGGIAELLRDTYELFADVGQCLEQPLADLQDTACEECTRTHGRGFGARVQALADPPCAIVDETARQPEPPGADRELQCLRRLVGQRSDQGSADVVLL